jgi:hypothetical protein
MIKRIETKAELRRLAAELHMRADWHEPEEQGVTAEVRGKNFDNAGFWGYSWRTRPEVYQLPEDHPDLASGEIYVTLYKEDKPVAEVNLATLFALACRI